MSIKGHHPEKDGILACLLAAETVGGARRESDLLSELLLRPESADLAFALRLQNKEYLGSKLAPGLGAQRIEEASEVLFFRTVDGCGRHGTSSSHSGGIRIGKGLGGAS